MLLVMGPKVSGILCQEALGQSDLLVVPDSHHLLPRGVGILVTVGVVQGEAIVLVKNGFFGIGGERDLSGRRQGRGCCGRQPRPRLRVR